MLTLLNQLSDVHHQKVAKEQDTELSQKLTLVAGAEYDAASGAVTYPLSRQQKGLWFDYKFNPQSNAYNTHSQLHIKNGLDLARFTKAVNMVCNLIPIYRTYFIENIVGEVKQLVSPACLKDEVLEFEDISDDSSLDEESKYQLALKKLYKKQKDPLNLESSDNYRMYLIKYDREKYIFTGVQHHIAIDGVSGLLFIESVILAYNGGMEALNQRFKNVYYIGDYLLEYEKLAEKIESAKKHWQSRLQGANLVLDIYGRSNQYLMKQERFALGEKRLKMLKEYSKRNKTTPFITLSTLYALLLYRYFGQTDILMGYPNNVRPKHLRDMFGYYIAVCPMRVQIDGEKNFKSLLEKITAEQKEDRDNLYLTTDQIIEIVDGHNKTINRDFNIVVGQSLFASNALPQMAGCEVDIEFGTGFEVKDLSFLFDLQTEDLGCRITYNSNLFDENFIKGFAKNYSGLLDAICAEGGDLEAMDQIKYINDEEWKKLTKTFNDTEFPYPQDKRIDEIFSQQVKKNPDAVAVIFGEQKLTYLELEKRSDELAICLQARGIKADDIVGLYIDRSLEMVLGMLAIMKAGAAYLPLDPSYPEDRLKYIIADSGLKILLTNHDLQNQILDVAGKDLPLLFLDEKNQGEAKLKNIAKSDNLAYVIYTSGSTGKPKGVMLEHRGFINMALDQIRQFGVNQEDRCLQFASQNFDASLYEIFMALFSGAALVIVPNEMRRNNELFAQYVKDHQVTVATLAPTFLKSQERKTFAGFRIIITAGEAANTEDAVYYAKNLKYINAYGPTESSVCAAVYHVSEKDNGKKIIPIGKPLSNSRIYILDQKQNILPIGSYGELHIGGDILARGYLGREDLSKEKFIADPFSKANNQRLYKSGDLARWLPDGNLEYLGRIDTQVKVRGFRIELGEIETCLNQHPSVKESAVIAKGQGENKQLIAYYLAAETVDEASLKNHLRAQLPEYMVPQLFVSIEKMPVNANGKIDRKFLEQKNIGEIGSKKYVALASDTEKTLAKIFAEVLKIKAEKIGSQDSFFELGGNSILVTQMISRIRNEFKIALELSVIFENPTIDKISQMLTARDGVDNLLQLKKVEKRPAEIPLSFCQERLWFLDRLESGARYNVPIALRIKGELRQDILFESLKKMVARHEIFRTRFVASSDQMTPYQLISPEIELDYEVLPYKLFATKVRELINQDVCQSFDISKGKLLRIKLFQLNYNDEYILYINMHHIISDGWSVGIFLEEISEIYNSLCAAGSKSLPELPIQYADYAIWQRQVLSSDILDRHIDYWVDQLKGYSNVIDLPTDYSRPVEHSGNGHIIGKMVSSDLTGRIKEYSKSQGYTVYMVLLSALYILLRRYSNQDDISIGSPIAGRQRQEAESLIGFFVNTLAFRINPQNSADLSIKDLLDLVKEVTIKGYAHQDAPFERVVEKINPTRDLSRSPIFQVLLAYQNTPGSNTQLNLQDTTVEAFDFSYDVSKFDFDLSISELNNEGGESFNILATYSTDLYHKETMERMLTHYVNILENIVANANCKLDKIKYLSFWEKQKLLADFNNIALSRDNSLCIHDLFAKQVKENPNNIAVTFDEESLTYQELDQKSEELAIYLQSIGAKADELIGICTDRSLEMAIGIMAIIKSGAPYVAFDITYPKDRLGYMFEDSQIKILLTQNKVRKNLLNEIPEVAKSNINIVEIDLEQKRNWNEQNQVLTRFVQPNNLVYVIYTSGSTGKPKGVMIEHHSLCNLITVMQKKLNFDSKDGLLALATYCFDMFELEMFLPLCSGAKYHICSKEKAQDAKLLRQKIAQTKPTLMQGTPSTWMMLFEDGWKNEENVEILCGGEALTAKLQQLFIANKVRAWNMYGPTEAAVWCSGKLIEAQDKNTLSVGKPLANNQIYILGHNNSLLPIGVYGELHIAGDHLARGYLNKPDLTKEKFIPNPFATKEEHEKGINQRLYKSGDLARWLADGNIEYFGRIDTQVKVRGFRIELGEIETCLNKYPVIKEVAVIASGVEENKKLVAYYVAPQELDSAELKKYLRQQLPEYMIPAFFTRLDNLPLNSNGKVDRKLLGQKEVMIVGNKSYVLPRNQVEEKLAAIFREVLKIKEEKISIEDSFFELGGHSLLAIHLMNKIKQEFARDINLSLLFQYPNIKELAVFFADKKSGAAIDENLILLQAKGDLEPIFAIPGVGGGASYFLDLANILGNDRPYYGLNYPSKSYRDIKTLASYYISLIKKVQKSGTYHLLGHSLGALIAFEMAYQLEQKGKKVLVINLDGRVETLALAKEKFHDLKMKDKNLQEIMTLASVLKFSVNNQDFDLEMLRSILSGSNKDQRYQLVQKKLSDSGIIPDSTTIDYLQYLARVIDMQIKINYEFLPEKKIRNMIYLKAENLPDGSKHDYDCGWHNYVENLEILESGGNHFSMVKKPYVSKLGEIINDRIVLFGICQTKRFA